MASLSRKYLASIGIEDDKADLIIEKHQEVVTEIKTERDEYKEQAEKVPALEKENAELKKASDDGKENTYKVKYEALKEEFESYKSDIESKATHSKKEDAYKKLLADAGVSEKRINAILKVSDIDSIEFDDEGKVKEEAKILSHIKEEWSDFIGTTSTKGAATATPPASTGKSTMTKEEIRKIEDPVARQKAMMENPALFGLPESN